MVNATLVSRKDVLLSCFGQQLRASTVRINVRYQSGDGTPASICTSKRSVHTALQFE